MAPTATAAATEVKKKRNAYVPKTVQGFNEFANALTKATKSIKDAVTKNVTKEVLPATFQVPTDEDWQAVLTGLDELKASYKELSAKKHKTAHPSLGLKTPQYMHSSMARFVNENGDLPKNLLIEIRGTKSVFNRTTLTQFCSYYANKNKLKSDKSKGMFALDKPMQDLFSAVVDGRVPFEALEARVKELQAQPDYNPDNPNRARFEKDANGKIVSVNNSAIQILFVPFFESNYSVPGKEEYIEKLKGIHAHFKKSSAK